MEKTDNSTTLYYPLLKTTKKILRDRVHLFFYGWNEMIRLRGPTKPNERLCIIQAFTSGVPP